MPSPLANTRASASGATSSAPIIESELTQCKRFRFHMKWTIHSFQLHQKFKATLYNSGVSMAELGLNDHEGRWRIRLGPSSQDLENVYVYLALTDTTEKGATAPLYSGASLQQSQHPDIPATAKVRVMTGKAAETVIMQEQTIRQIFDHKTNPLRRCVISYASLFGSNEQPGQLRDGCITISMQVTLTLHESISTVTTTGQREFTQRQMQWADSGHEYDTDFVLRSMDGKKFFANPFLLTAHSPVFAAMLSHDTKEKRTMCCEMDDVDGETVVILLDYLYGCETGKINAQTAERVLLMADKYQLMHLRSVTEQVLIGTITMENAVHCLRFANLHKLDGLNGACLNVIDKNMGTILSDEELVKSDPEMMKVIIAHCAEKARVARKALEL